MNETAIDSSNNKFYRGWKKLLAFGGSTFNILSDGLLVKIDPETELFINFSDKTIVRFENLQKPKLLGIKLHVLSTSLLIFYLGS